MATLRCNSPSVLRVRHGHTRIFEIKATANF
jgi:hypothetical protein